jgi:peptidoglycan hydrolase FlgJ
MPTPLSRSPYAGLTGARAATTATPALQAKAKSAAEDFEGVFLNSMFQQMLSSVKGDGPFGGGTGTAVWRSLLAEEYAKSFAKAGGIGIGTSVYGALLQQQEARKS